MRRLGFGLTLIGLLAMVGRSEAQGCHVVPMPAATLLLPYFEVDLNSSNGMNTLVSVNNASTQPALVKAEVWTDLGVPIFGFMSYLKGDDVQTINLSDILVYGRLPQTAPSPGTFASCTGFLPPATISPGLLFNYQHAMTGQSADILGGRCAGRNLHDNVARGYITFDTVGNCTSEFQGNAGVFNNGGTGVYTNQNVLWGDYFYTNASLAQAEGHDLVHIRADATSPSTSVSGQYTFYGALDNWQAVDNRIPLATNFAVRYFNSFPLASDVVVWRDPKSTPSTFPCGSFPPWYPLGQTRITAFDEDAHATTITTSAFPAVAQRVHVGGSALPVPYSFGWLSLDLNHTASVGNVPPADPLAEQAWVTATMVNGSLLLGVDAIRLDSACNARHSGL